MSTQRQNQAKPSSPSSALPVQTGLFQPSPFTDFSPEADEALDASHQPPDLQTQLDRASRFGHNFSRVQVQAPPSAVIQPQMERGTLEEQEEDSEFDSVAESVKQMAPPGGDPSQPPDQEEELVQTMPLLGVLPPVIQRQDQEEELVQAMPLLGVLPPTIQRQDQEEEFVQMMPHWGRLPPTIQRQEQEEEFVQMMPHWGRLQRLPQDEDDSSIQMMPQWGVIQRQEPESVEEAIQSQWLQPKLVVGQVGDRYEQEADSVAAQVMSMSAPSAIPEPIQRQSEEEDEQESLVQKSPLADSITPLVQRQTEEQEEPIQAKSLLQRVAKNNAEVGSNLENKLSNSKGGGSPLPDEVRSFMEPRFGTDFSQVRVHTDSSAVQMNKELHAQAFTHGSNIYYGAGKSPGTDALTAHELTHVVQQTGAVQPQSIDNKQQNQFQQEEEELKPLQAKLDTSQPEQADHLTFNQQAETSESTQAVELIVVEVIESLQTDPEDSSGQVRYRLKSLEPSTRKMVMVQLQNRIPLEQWQRLSKILADPGSSEGEESLSSPQQEEIAPPETEVATDSREGDREEASSASSGQSDTRSSQVEPDEARKQDIPDRDTPPAKASPEDKTEAAEPKTAPPSADASESISGTAQIEQPPLEIPQEATEEGTIPEQQIAESSGNAESTTDGSTRSTSPSMSAGEANASTQAVTNASSAESSRAGVAIAQNNSLPSTENQTPSTNFAGTQIVLDQVTAAANAARQRFTERITQGTEAIAASVRQQQEALISASDQQGSAIQTLFANAREQVGQIISSAQAQLQTDATSHLATLQQEHTTTLGEVQTTFSSSQEQAQELGDSYAEQSLETADNSAEQVQSRLEGMAEEARLIGQEKAQVGGSTPEIAQAKAQAANEIASDTADKITSGMSDAMRDLRATGPETASSFREQGQEAAFQLGEGQGQVVEQLNTSNQETVAAIQQAVSQGNQALGNLRGQLIEQLVSLEQTIQNQLQAQVAQKSQELYAAGEQAINTFQEQGQQAIASGDEHLAQFNQQVAGMDIDPELAAEATTEIVGQVDDAYNNLMLTADSAFQQADSALVEAGNQVLTAIGSVSSNAAGQIQTFLGQAQGQVSQQVTSISDQLGTTVSQASDAESGMVSEVASSLDEQISQLDSGFGEGLEEYTGGLDEQVTSVEEQASEPKESVAERSEEAQQRAEERAQNSWLENQWNDFVDMVSSPGFWAGLVVGLLVGAFVIATFGTGAVALVAAGAIAGAAAGFAGTVASNYAAGRENLFEGAGRNALWGAFGGAAGAAALVFLGGGFIAGGAIGGVASGLGLTASQTLALLVGGASATAGLVTILDNVSNPERSWDEGLLANMLLAGVFTWLGGRLSRRSVDTPESTPRQPGDTPESTRLPVEEPESTRSPRSEVDSPEQSPRGCFVAGTKVLTPEGEKTIETLTNDEAVWSLDPSSNSKKEQFIQCISVRSVPKVLDIQVGGTTITCSPEHPFWVSSQGWVKAGELQVGWTLLSLNKGTITIDNIQVRVGSFTVHNIEVNGLHNYCVSPLGVLVHNKAMRWNLQDRAAALRGRITDLLEQVRELPEDAPNKAELLRQLQEAEPEANRLAKLAEESDAPDALESSRSSIEALEERLGNLERQVDIAEIPSRVPELEAEAKALEHRAKEIPQEVPERWGILERIKNLKQDIDDLRTLIDEGLADESIVDEYHRLRRNLAELEREIIGLEPAPLTVWEQRLDRAKWKDHGRKHMQARSAEQAREMTTPTDRNPDPASQYLPEVNNQALELEALRNGEVIRGNPDEPGGTVHVKYDAGRVIGYDGGEPVTTMRAEITDGNEYHGHPRKNF